MELGHVVELDVCLDGGAVAFCRGMSDWNREVFVLPLMRPLSERGLPRRAGEPRQVTRGEGQWHAHTPAWYRDGSRLIYSRFDIQGDVYVVKADP